MLSDLKKTINLILLKKISKADPMDGLENKIVLITGASKGIGLSIAQYLSDQKCKLILLSRGIDSLKSELGSNPNISLFECDITQPDEVNLVIKSAIAKLGKIDVVINNAGVNIDKPIEESTPADINKIIDTNIKGLINVCVSILPILKTQKSGTIINIGSKISHNTNIRPNKVLYATTKYAVEGFSFALNKELKGTGVRCTCLMPGTVNTFVSTKSGNYMSPIRIAQIIGMIIKFHDIDFEGIVFKSIDQDI